MTTVNVRGFSVVRDVFRAPVVEVEVPYPETVEAVLDALLRKYDGRLRETICDSNTGEMAPFLVQLNEEIVSSTLDKDRPVKNGDEPAIIFPIGGGC